jgi:flavin-binding protein dodecin
MHGLPLTDGGYVCGERLSSSGSSLFPGRSIAASCCDALCAPQTTVGTAIRGPDVIVQGIARASKTLRQIRSAWVKEQEVTIKDGKIVAYKVNLKVTFVLDDAVP